MLRRFASTTPLRSYSVAMSTKGASFAESGIQWILDWDGTITQHDTLNALVSVAASTKPAFPTLERWSEVTNAYLQDYTATLEKLIPDAKLPNDLLEEKKLLHNLRAVEKRSLARVSDSGIFAGLTEVQIEQGARKALVTRDIEIRSGFEDFFRATQNRILQGEKVTILSVNWSRQFLAACLAASGSAIPLSDILCNELEGIDRGAPSTGRIVPSIIASEDKLQELEHLGCTNLPSNENRSIVYVGDSWTDLEALLAADLGICIRSDPIGGAQQKVADALERLDIACPHLADWSSCDKWSVVWARDFDEIRAWADTVR